jgi:pyruvyltransferase
MKIGLNEDVSVPLKEQLEKANESELNEADRKVKLLPSSIFSLGLTDLTARKEGERFRKVLVKGAEGAYLPIYYTAKQESEDFGALVLPYLLKKSSGKELEESINKLSERAHLLVGEGAFSASSLNSIIWGAGLLRDETFKRMPSSKEVLAVRGPLTRKHLLNSKVPCPKVYGDPALLLPRFYQPKVEKKYSVGIVPHQLDYEEIRKSYEGTDVHVISPITDNIESVIDQINQCERIVSSSLHGVITAHAYGIPAVWSEFSKSAPEGRFQYRDYFSSLGMPYIESPLVLDSNGEVYSSLYLSNLVDWNFQPKFPIDTDAFYNSCPFAPNSLESQKISESLKGSVPLLLTLATSKELSALVVKNILPFIKDVNTVQCDTKRLNLKGLKDNRINSLSVEGLFENKEQLMAKLKNLKAITKSSECKIVLAIQNQSDLIFQAFKALKSKKEQLAFYKNIKGKKILDYSQFLDCLKSVFAGQKVHFFALEKFMDDPELAVSKLIDFVNPGKHDASFSAVKKAKFTSLMKIFASMAALKNYPSADHPLNNLIKMTYGKANDAFSKEHGLNLQVYNYPSVSKEIYNVLPRKKLNEVPAPHENLRFLNKIFEKVYVINLDRSKERMAAFKAHVEDLGGLDFERFSAVDGKKIENPKSFNFPTKKSLGSLGCLLSHYQLIKNAFKEKSESILILEDDTRFSPQLKENLGKSLKELPKDWDFLFLGGQFFNIPSSESTSSSVFKGAGVGGFAYAVSRKGAEKVYTVMEEKLKCNRELLHNDIEFYYGAYHYLNAYRVYPWVAHYTSGLSTHRFTSLPETYSVSFFYKNEINSDRTFNLLKMKSNFRSLIEAGLSPRRLKLALEEFYKNEKKLTYR